VVRIRHRAVDPYLGAQSTLSAVLPAQRGSS
jgi:hypothetical protein